jgi:hypothetical protein
VHTTTSFRKDVLWILEEIMLLFERLLLFDNAPSLVEDEEQSKSFLL